MEHTVQKTSALRECKFFSGSLFLDNLKRLFYVPVMLFFILVMTGPFRLSNYLSSGEDIIGATVAEYVARICSPTLICVAAFVVACGSFSFLFSRRASFHIHSLPFRRSTIFVSGLVSGFLMLVVPFVLCVLVDLPLVSGVGDKLLYVLMISFLSALGELIFFYGLSLFIIMCTGILVAAPIFYLIFNSLYFVMASMIQQIADYFSFGWYGGGGFFGSTLGSPFWHLFSTGVGAQIGYDDGKIYVTNGTYVAVIALVGVALIMGAYVIYKRKQAESTGTLLPERWTRPIFRWGMAFFLSLFMGMFIREGSNIITGDHSSLFILFYACFVVVGILAFFLSQMLIKKSFRVFTKKLAVESGTMVAFFFLIFYLTSCLGHSQTLWVPTAQELNHVKVYTREGNMDIKASDKKNMDLILKTHKSLIENRDEIQEERYQYASAGYPYVENYQYIEFIYHLKDGTIKERAYDFPPTGKDTEYEKNISNLEKIAL